MPKEHANSTTTSRRSVLQAAAATVAAAHIITTRKSEAQPVPPALLPPSPGVRPWVEALPVSYAKPSVSSLGPTPGKNPVAGEAGRAAHQAWDDFPPDKLYEISVKEASHSFHPDLRPASIWGYDGTFPGSLIHARYGESLLVRFRNDLPANAAGPGVPEISTHLHNMHTPSESDGYPLDYYSASTYGPTLTRPGSFKDHHYPMRYAGFKGGLYGPLGDPREALGTMWYHDHRVDYTSQNVYRGLCGYFLAFDAIDSGNENDSNPAALRLPSGHYDVPLVISNHHFDAQGNLFFDPFNNDGFIGDTNAINGKVQPFFNVARRKYRFRFLNASIARFYDLQIRYQNVVQSFSYIANDGNLLERPLSRSRVLIAPSERGDIVIDFARFPEGAKLYLTNRAVHEDGRRLKDDKFLSPPTPMMEFRVGKAVADPSRVPGFLRAQPDIPADLSTVPVREFQFDRSSGMWTINEELFDNTPRAQPTEGSAEIWVLRNIDDGWHHPVHIHFEEFRILSRDGVAPQAHERGRKDTVWLKDEEIRIFRRFRDFKGKYVMHCHNLTHEDHSMMMRFDII